MLSQPLNPRLPALAWICGSSLLLAVVITVLHHGSAQAMASNLSVSVRIPPGASQAVPHAIQSGRRHIPI